MEVISGTINTSLPGVSEKIIARNEKWVLEETERQISYGSDTIAINCGTHIVTETEDLLWLENIIQSNFDIPLWFDSPSIQAQTACCRALKRGQACIDSITLEEQRIREFMPLIQEMDAKFIILLYDEAGMPHTVEDRLRVMPKVERLLEHYHIDPKNVYLDCLLFPVSTVENACMIYVDSCRAIRAKYPEFQLSCGLNNVSYGLPEKNLLNMVMMSMIASFRQDAAIIEMDPQLCAHLKAVRVMAGEDEYCLDYIAAYRAGLLTRD